MMFYFFYSLIVQPFLLFYHAITYGELLTETMRVADDPRVLDLDDQGLNNARVHEQGDLEKTKEIELPELNPAVGTAEWA